MCCERELCPASLCEEPLQFRICSLMNTQGPSRKVSVASLTGSSVHGCFVRRKFHYVPGSEGVVTPGLPRRLPRRVADRCCELLGLACLVLRAATDPDRSTLQ